MERFLNATVCIEKGSCAVNPHCTKDALYITLKRKMMEITWRTLKQLKELVSCEYENIILFDLQKCRIFRAKIMNIHIDLYLSPKFNCEKILHSLFKGYIVLFKDTGEMKGALILFNEEENFLKEIARYSKSKMDKEVIVW